VLPAVTPDKATDFLGLKPLVSGVLLMSSILLSCDCRCAVFVGAV
jgi:hypothetical protein